MVLFYRGLHKNLFAVEVTEALSIKDLDKLKWLFGNAEYLEVEALEGFFVGPRKEMITPWSTNAVEITQNMGTQGIIRIEEFNQVENADASFDSMLQAFYENLDQQIFFIDKTPEAILPIDDIRAYNEKEGLALSEEEVQYLESVSERLGRKLTDSEVFGFSQVNSEHCRHKIFNGTFIIDGVEKEKSLFKMIKETTKENPNTVVSAYKDNVAFVQGPKAEQFAPTTQDKADFFETKEIETILSLKAETHNFPTTVEPFNGAATGTGGEIRDRMAGGKASIPLAGTAVYMTSYSRTEEGRVWEENSPARPWLYQTPMDLLIKASNGASDFGNKFGQPLICGSVLTFEHQENDKKYGYDKVIMQAGGIGFGKKIDAKKDVPEKGDKIVILGGDNYRIGMGGSAVSSVATGQFNNSIELNAVQRSNPEMQKRVCNTIRALSESETNPVVMLHDHGAGGHLNCLSELVEDTGGTIDLNKLPVGDPTLSAKEIVGNESQERMGLVMKEKDLHMLEAIAARERAPMYTVGETTGDMHFKFEDKKTGANPIDWPLEDMFGNSPKTVLKDESKKANFEEISYDKASLPEYLTAVLQLEAVACKDWLTNKVDRSVTGRVAKQQTAGPIQLPLNDVAAMAIDYRGKAGIATAIGHAPIAAMIDPVAGSQNAIAESLTNIVWAPLKDQLKSISLSANWMWPCKNKGEDARLYAAVEGVSDFAKALGINIPTGKDSLSMTQKYKNDTVYSPGTVIITSAGEVSDIKKIVSPVIREEEGSAIFYLDFSSDALKLGGSSFAQIHNKVGKEAPSIKDAAYFKKAFNAIQTLIEEGEILAGHDISAGGLITTLAEMTFAQDSLGLDLDLSAIEEKDIIKLLFAENAGVVIQVKDETKAKAFFEAQGLNAQMIGIPYADQYIRLRHGGEVYDFEIASLRDAWFKPSYLLDKKQSGEELAKVRFENYAKQPLVYKLPENFEGTFAQYSISPDRKEKSGARAAIIREKGVNGDREMAYALHLAGFDVKDVHMTDLISGRENLEDIQMIVFVGGFSNSDVLGSAKGWAGAFLYNEKAKQALDNFYARKDTLSLGVCNGCQLMQELALITKGHEAHPKMLHNDSHKFESGFITMNIPQNDTVMFSSLSDTRMGIWIAHGEGKFSFPQTEENYNIVGKYSYEAYPANPNGSDFGAAAIASDCGRHLAMMPHLERATFPWNWAHYAEGRQDEVSPWIEAFVNARKWVEKN